MLDIDVSDVLTGGVDDVEAGSEILADGGGNNSEVKGEVVGTFSVDKDILEAELADFDFAGSGGSSRVNLVDDLFGIVFGVLVREHDLAGAHLVLIGRDNSSEVETFVSESGLNIFSGELNGEGNFVVSLDGDDGGCGVASEVAVFGELHVEVNGDVGLGDVVGGSLLFERNNVEVAWGLVEIGGGVFGFDVGLVLGVDELKGSVVAIEDVRGFDLNGGEAVHVVFESFKHNLFKGTDDFLLTVSQLDGSNGVFAAGLSVEGSSVGSNHLALIVGLFSEVDKVEFLNLKVALGASEAKLSFFFGGENVHESGLSSLVEVVLNILSFNGSKVGRKSVAGLFTANVNGDGLSLANGLSEVNGNILSKGTGIFVKSGSESEIVSAITQLSGFDEDVGLGGRAFGVVSFGEVLDFSFINLDLASLSPIVFGSSGLVDVNEGEVNVSGENVFFGDGIDLPGVLLSNRSSGLFKVVVFDIGGTAESACVKGVVLVNINLEEGVGHEGEVGFQYEDAVFAVLLNVEVELTGSTVSSIGTSMGVSNVESVVNVTEIAVLSDRNVLLGFTGSRRGPFEGSRFVSEDHGSFRINAPLVDIGTDAESVNKVVVFLIGSSGKLFDASINNALGGMANLSGGVGNPFVVRFTLTVPDDDFVLGSCFSGAQNHLLSSVGGSGNLVRGEGNHTVSGAVFLNNLVGSLEVNTVLKASSGEHVLDIKVKLVFF